MFKIYIIDEKSRIKHQKYKNLSYILNHFINFSYYSVDFLASTICNHYILPCHLSDLYRRVGHDGVQYHFGFAIFQLDLGPTAFDLDVLRFPHL